MRIVFDIGGFVFVFEDLDIDFIKVIVYEFVKISEDYEVVVVVGGGKVVRKYIQVVKEFMFNEIFKDYIGIYIMRVNVMFFIVVFGEKVYFFVVQDFCKVWEVIQFKKILIMGGIYFGYMIDVVVVFFVEYLQVDFFVVVINVDGVYDLDLKKNFNVKKFDRIIVDQFVEIVMQEESKVGGSGVVDVLVVKFIQRGKIKIYIVGKKDVYYFFDVIKGKYSGIVVEL